MSEEVKPEAAQTNTETAEGKVDLLKTEATAEAPAEKEMSDRLYPDHDKADEGEKPKEDEVEKTEEEKPKEDEGEDDKAADKKADEDYTLELSEGSHVKQSRLDEIVADARKQGLSKDQAQALVDREQQAISTYLEQEKSALEERSQQWVEDVKSDQEIGGEKFGASVEQAKRVISKYASDSLKDMLEKTGLGNHPEVVRLFARVGKEMASDSFVNAPAGNVPVKQAKSYAERLYGNTTPN